MALTLFRRLSQADSSLRSPHSALLVRDAERLRRYRELLDFYEGKHFPAARRGRTNLVVNYARTVVDKGVSYLFGRGVRISVPAGRGSAPFPLPLAGGEGEGKGGAAEAERLLNWLAEENELDLVLLQAATNAAVLGDAVLKVFWDPNAAPLTPALSPSQGERAKRGRARVVNVDPLRTFPTWASDDLTSLREVVLVGQLGADEARERYGVQSPGSRVPGQGFSGKTLDSIEIWTAESYRLIVGGVTVHAGPNPYGFIPFVYVANLQPPNRPWGVSDLVDLIPLNRELDERMSDQADVIRYHADPPVVFQGVEQHSDLPVGPGTVWDLPRDASVSLLEWRGNAPAVQEHVERVLRTIYEVTETPRTSFGDSGRLLSGVALETELQPLIHRTLRKRVIWSAALRRCNRMLLLLTERFGPGLAPGSFAPYRSEIVWPPMLPRDDDAEARRNLDLVAGGLRSHRRAMEALGELNPEAELQRVRADQQELSAESL